MKVTKTLKRVGGLFRSLRFRPPPKAPVAIFDRAGSERIIDHLLDCIDYAILDVRERVYYLNVGILVHLAKRVMRAHLEFPTYKNGKLSYIRSAINSLPTNNRLSFLDYVNPKVIITAVDNSGEFHKLSCEYDGPVFIAVQNGMRIEINMRTALPPIWILPKIKSKCHYFSFGQYTEDLYKKYGHEIATFHHVGSSTLGHYVKNVRGKMVEQRIFDICIISQWRKDQMEANPDPANEQSKWSPLFANSLRTTNEFVLRYCEENSATSCVALRTDDPLERAFYDEGLNGKAVLIPRNMKEMSSYRAADQSQVVIACHSALLYEAHALGRRVLFCNFTGLDIFDPPVLGPWFLNTADYALFKDRMDLLLHQSDEEYRRVSRNFTEYLMNNDPERPPYEVIRNMIDGILDVSGAENYEQIR